MSSRGKKKTTMAKLNREARLRERRDEKRARKEARRLTAALPTLELPAFDSLDGDLAPHEGAELDREPSS